MGIMKCQQVSKDLSLYLDGQLSENDRQTVTLHLARCSRCSSEREALELIRRSLNALPTLEPPAGLTTALRVIASRELARRSSRKTVPALYADWRDSLRLWMNNLMRPFALPVAGGLISALMIFALLVPNFFGKAVAPGADVPTVLYTEANLRSTGPLNYTDDVEVELVIDEQGRMVDYTLPSSVMQNPELRRKIESDLLLTRFYPATAFGLPTSGKVKLSFKKSFIDVKG
jgi:hypothetical protein